MTGPDLRTLYDVIDGTWPAARYVRCGPFTLREGAGGGQRVSAATTDSPATLAEIAAAEAAMRAMAQAPLFMIRAGQEALDQQLDSRGYAVVDPVNLYVCPVAQLMGEPIPPVTVIPVWEPLAIQRDIWAAGGIGPGRVAVMERAPEPKTAMIARWNNHPGGCAFVGIHAGTAMLHALEILPLQRNQGLGKWIMRRAAFWAAEHGAAHLSVACTKANAGANALYTSLGMALAGQYHYRKLDADKAD
jgi:GNAT superfamily N-acetyltransferase